MALANRHSAGTVWLPTGNPDTTNITSTDFLSLGGQPGSLGIQFDGGVPNRSYQRVQLDSGATSATAIGVVAANQLAYWKDKTNYIVTNDVNQAIGAPSVAETNNNFRNYVAGIFRTAVTAGNYCDVLQRGLSISVKTTGSPAIGDKLVSDTSTSTARAAVVTPGTAPTVQIIGTARGPAVANVTPCDVDVINIQ